MSKNRTYMCSLAAVVLILLTACSKNEVNPVLRHGRISYNTVIGTQVKAAITGTVYDQSLSFCSAAFLNRPGTSSRTESTPYIPESVVSYDGIYWTTATACYWPGSGSLTFMSYSPSALKDYVDITKDGISVTSWNSEAAPYKGVDFMVADIRIGEDGHDENPVPTIFRHKLAKISISANIENEDNEIVIKKVTLKDIITQADYLAGLPANPDEWTNLSDVWVLSTVATDLVFKNATDTELTLDRKSIGEEYLAIPQHLVAHEDVPPVELVIDYTDAEGDKNISITLSDHGSSVWPVGSDIHYNLTFGSSDHPIEFDGSVNEWTDYVPGPDDIIIGQ